MPRFLRVGVVNDFWRIIFAHNFFRVVRAAVVNYQQFEILLGLREYAESIVARMYLRGVVCRH